MANTLQLKHLNPVEKFFTKNDPEDPRLGDYAKSLSENSQSKDLQLDSDSIVIVGYPDDEGIANNGGRIGAKEAPQKIREFFYKMTPHLLKSHTPKIIDAGDLKLESSLEERHQHAQSNLENILRHARAITLGGGHDYGYPDGAAFLEVFTEKPLIINFDAHLDVRPHKDKITSGTPFYRLLTKYTDFDFAEIGIQSQCNSRHHLKWAQEHNAKVLSFDEIQYSGESQSAVILRFLEPFMLKKRACFISIDIDGCSSAYAPGCSQSFATGFDPANFFTVFNVLCERLDVKLLGIYEVSPPLDPDNRTSKLAAQIISESL
jgi:formiminoglutamase